MTSKKRMQMQEKGLRTHAAKLDGQAREALATGNEDLARAALQRKQAIETELGSLDQQVSELEGQQEQLTAGSAVPGRVDVGTVVRGGCGAATAGRRGDAGRRPATLRVVAWSAAAMATTAGIGALVGTVT